MAEFSTEIGSKIDRILESSPNGSLSAYLLKDKSALQSFLEDLRLNYFKDKEIWKSISLRSFQEVLEKWEERLLNVVEKEEDSSVLKSVEEVIKNLLRLRVCFLIKKHSIASIVYFLGYYFDKSFVSFSSRKGLREGLSLDELKSLEKFSLPVLRVSLGEGVGSLGGSFDIKDNLIEFYSNNPYIHAYDDILGFIVAHEMGHYYFSFLRELFFLVQKMREESKYKTLPKEVLWKEAIKRNIENYETWVVQNEWGAYLNLFEDFRVEKSVFSLFKTVRKHARVFADFLLDSRLEKLKELHLKFIKDRPEVFMNRDARRLYFLDMFGIYCRFFVDREIYGVSFEKLNELKRYFLSNVLVKDLDREFFDDFLRTAKDYANAFTLAEGYEILKSFFGKWFPRFKKVKKDLEQVKKEEEAFLSPFKDDFFEKAFGKTSSHFSESEKENLSSLSSEARTFEEQTSKEEQSSEKECLGSSFSGFEDSEKKEKREGEGGEEKIFEKTSSERIFEDLESFLKKFDRELNKELQSSFNSLEDSLERLQENLKHHGKSIEFVTKDVVESQDKRGGPGAGILSSISKWYEVSLDNEERFFVDPSIKKPEVFLKDEFFKRMVDVYLEGVAFAKRIRGLCSKSLRNELFEDEEGGRLSVRSFVRESAKEIYQKERGIISSSRSRIFLTEEEKEILENPKKIDVVIDTSGSMAVVARYTLETASFLMGVSDGFTDARKEDKFFFRFFAVRGEDKDLILDFVKFLKEKGIVRKLGEDGKYFRHGLFLLRSLSFSAGREGYSAYVEPILNYYLQARQDKKGNKKSEFFFEQKPVLAFVITDGHFVTKKDWEIVRQLKENKLFLTCGIYCTDEVKSEVVENLKNAFDGYFISNLVNLKVFIQDFLTTFFKKKNFDVLELNNVINKIKTTGLKYQKLFDFSFSI